MLLMTLDWISCPESGAKVKPRPGEIRDTKDQLKNYPPLDGFQDLLELEVFLGPSVLPYEC